MEKSLTHPKLSIIADNQQLIIEKKWNRTLAAVFIGFSIVWTTISIFISSGFFSSIIDFGNAPSILMILPLVFGLIPLLFIFIGLALFYGGLCILNNTTKITVDQHLFTVKSGPLPLLSKQRIAISSIKQIYIHEQSNTQQKKQGPAYQLSFINASGESDYLFGKLPFLPISLPALDLDEAQYLERLLEDFMGIENKAVAMEVGATPTKSLDEEIESSNKSYWESKESFENEKNKEEQLNAKTEEFESSAYQSLEEQPSSNTAGQLLANPQSLVVEESSDGLFILKKWRNPVVLFFLIFSIIWNSIIWVIASFLFKGLLSSSEISLIIPLLFIIPFIAIGIWIAYMSVAVIFNSTHIFINQHSFRLSHRPIPAGKRIDLKSQDIVDINLKEEIRSGKNGTYSIHLLEAIDHNGRRYKMNTRNKFMTWNKEEAEFIQRKIKRYLQLN